MKNTLNKCNSELKFDKIDGLLAVFMGCYNFLCMCIAKYIVFDSGIYNKFLSYFDNVSFARFLFYIPIGFLELFPIFIILRHRKQSLRSIGFNKIKILKQIIIGITLYIPVGMLLLILNWKSGININLGSMSIWNFLYYLIIIALVEEIIFRGFIQQRLNGLIKNKYINLLVAAFIFGVIHIPFRLAQGLTFIQVLISIIPVMVFHIYFVGIYKAGGNSVLSPTIAHAISDFIGI